MQLDDDVLCMECGYNLHGLRGDGRCPECGREIIETIRRQIETQERIGAPLTLSSPAWLGRLREGVWMIVMAALFQFLVNLLWMTTPKHPAFYMTASLIGWTTADVLLAAGAWRLGTLEGLTDERMSDFLLSVTIRAGAIYPILIMVFLRSGVATSRERDWGFFIFGVGAGITTFAAYIWIARLLVRMDRPRAGIVSRYLACLLSIIILVTDPFRNFPGPLGLFYRQTITMRAEPIVGYAPSLPTALIYRSMYSLAVPWALWGLLMALSYLGLGILLIFGRGVAGVSAGCAAREK
jgi:hypothetical protein